MRQIIAICVVIIAAMISADLPWPRRQNGYQPTGISGPITLAVGIALAAFIFF